MYEPYPEVQCNECCENENVIEEVRYWAQGLLDIFYSNEPLQAQSVEHCLEEMLHQIGMKLPQGEINLGQHKEVKSDEKCVPLNNVLEAWKSANQSYLSNLTYSN